jgi:hypothetical protein
MHRRFVLALPLLIAACGAPVIDQRQLKIVADPHTIVFDREFRYDISRETDLPRPRPGQFRGLLKGVYTARYEDATGIYYANDHACVIYGTELEQQRKFVSAGGIWIARSPSARPAFRLYWIAGRPGPLPTPIDAEPACGEIGAPAANPPGPAVPIDPVVTTQILQRTAPQATPVTAGAGLGLSVGLIEATAEYERGKIVLMPSPVPGTPINALFRVQGR